MGKWFLFGGIRLPIHRSPESRYIRILEISHQLLTVASHAPSHPLEMIAGEEIMYSRDCVENPYKNPPLDCRSPIHDPFIIE